MSAFIRNTTCIRDINLLKDALKENGYPEVEVNEEAQNLYGYHGDKRDDKAELIIRRKHIGSVSNDIGFKKNKDGNYDAIISQYDSSKHNSVWLNKVKSTYTTLMVKKTMKSMGATKLSESTIQKNGKPVNRLQFVMGKG